MHAAFTPAGPAAVTRYHNRSSTPPSVRIVAQGASDLCPHPRTLQNGLPVYVYRLASLTPPIQKELAAVPAERRYQRM